MGATSTQTQKKSQAKAAQGCDTAVVTETGWNIHRSGIATALRRLDGSEGPYDLLSTPSLATLAADASGMSVLAGDVVTALDLHQVERVVVVSHSADPQVVIRRLKEARQELRSRNVRLTGFALSQRQAAVIPTPTTTLVVSCMDWRLHGPRLGKLVKDAFGARRFDLLATAGGAKELVTGPRADMVFGQIIRHAPKLERLILLSHTDCGKYGGNKAFASESAQNNCLHGDLTAAAAAFKSLLPRVTVDTGVMVVNDSRLERVTTSK